jgi:HEPN domain-containing protein
MQNETKMWIEYSKENFQSAKILIKSELYNPCLQNVQQCVEKAIKSILVENSQKLKKTHNILELKHITEKLGFKIEISEEECDFLDSIYLPSKYPIGGVLPDYQPNEDICNKAIQISKRVLSSIENILKKESNL